MTGYDDTFVVINQLGWTPFADKHTNTKSCYLVYKRKVYFENLRFECVDSFRYSRGIRVAVDEELLDVEMASLFHINTAHLGLRTNLLHMSAAPVYRVYIFIVGRRRRAEQVVPLTCLDEGRETSGESGLSSVRLAGHQLQLVMGERRENYPIRS